MLISLPRFVILTPRAATGDLAAPVGAFDALAAARRAAVPLAAGQNLVRLAALRALAPALVLVVQLVRA